MDAKLKMPDYGFEELEGLEAPGFWKGFKDGFTAGVAVAGLVGVGVAIVAVT